MAVRSASDIRNIALLGQAGSGKTTLLERLLLATGAITRMGSVEEGNTYSDWTDEEKHHKHSLRPTVGHVDHEGHRVNIIDTPGLGDFLGHAIACLPAVETAVVVVDASKGVEPVTRRMMTVAAERNLPRMIVVNKIGEQQADLAGVVESLRDEFGSVCLPINLPNTDRSDVIDVFEHEAEADTLFSSVAEAHQNITEQVVEVDEDLMTQYLEEGAEGLDPAAISKAFAQALREGHLVPICFVSAKDGQGTDALLHIFASLLPSPLEGNPRTFIAGSDEIHGSPDSDKPLLAHVFKISTDPFVGKLGVFRVHQGMVKSKSEVGLSTQKKGVRVGQVLERNGKESNDAEQIGPGDIGAVAKIDEIQFNAVMHNGDHADIKLKPLPLPRPMYGLAIELKNHADEGKFSTVAQKIMAEDPCLVVERIAATRQTVMRGLGELHLRVVLEKFKDQYGIELLTETPKIAYKETISGRAEGHHRHKKQTGGAGQFGEVYLRVEPLPEDSEVDDGFEFVNETVGGSIPRQFMPAIEKGIRQVLGDGAVAGYPLSGVRVAVYDGKHHAVDSKEVAFITAGKKAFVDAVKNASPVLREPFVTIEVTAPQQYMGDITGDLANRRGRVQDTKMLAGDQCTIIAQAPLSELQSYSTELKSMTGGAGSYAMEYSHDENTPPHIQQEVVAAYKPTEDDD